MKMKHLGLLIMAFFLAIQANAQKDEGFSSAEERVKFNIENNIDDFDGCVVNYYFDIIQGDQAREKQIFAQIQNNFIGLIDVTTVQEGEKRSIRISTNGTTKNNPIYYNLLQMYSRTIKQGKREMLLK
ncbi:MAG: hypothetical protein R2799_07805 [Crocinitomicaceae bacterium]